MAAGRKSVPSALVALAAWVCPGAGYWLLGQRGRGATVGIAIALIFAMGLLVGGINVVQAPNGLNLSDILQKPWFIGQALAGPMALVIAWITAHAQPPLPTSLARSWEIGTLYTAVAGMLNLMAVIDSSYRAGSQA
jgi:hypothetical protein